MDWRTLPVRWILGLLSQSWRIRDDIPAECSAIVQGREPGIVVFWHGGMFPVWYRFRGGGFGALVSASRDGKILSEYLERTLGYRVVIRGSSSRGGSEALNEMVQTLENRGCLVTPDGPRGPAGEAKPGALVAARRSGRSVVAVGWWAKRSWQLRSWDSMRIPYPFSRIVFRYCKVTSETTIASTRQVSRRELLELEELLCRVSSGQESSDDAGRDDKSRDQPGHEGES